MERLKTTYFRLSGETGKLCRNISDRWLKGIAETNPAILSIFADRDVRPYRDLLAWSGEFAGKYLTGACFVWRMTGDRALKRYVSGFIDRLLAYQDEDGYLGCYSRETRFTARFRRRPKRGRGRGIAGRITTSPSGCSSGTTKREKRRISAPPNASPDC